MLRQSKKNFEAHQSNQKSWTYSNPWIQNFRQNLRCFKFAVTGFTQSWCSAELTIEICRSWNKDFPNSRATKWVLQLWSLLWPNLTKKILMIGKRKFFSEVTMIKGLLRQSKKKFEAHINLAKNHGLIPMNSKFSTKFKVF